MNLREYSLSSNPITELFRIEYHFITPNWFSDDELTNSVENAEGPRDKNNGLTGLFEE